MQSVRVDQGKPSEGKTTGGGERGAAQAEAQRCQGPHRQPGLLMRLFGTQAEKGQEGRLL